MKYPAEESNPVRLLRRQPCHPSHPQGNLFADSNVPFGNSMEINNVKFEMNNIDFNKMNLYIHYVKLVRSASPQGKPCPNTSPIGWQN